MALTSTGAAAAVIAGTALGAGGMGALEIAEPVIGGRASEVIAAARGAARGAAAAISITGSADEATAAAAVAAGAAGSRVG
jgi:hypothetical protein